MNCRWMVGLDEEDKKFIKALLKSDQGILKRLSVVLNDDLEKSIAGMEREKDFQNAAWPYQQAYKLGEQACLRRLLKFINIEEE